MLAYKYVTHDRIDVIEGGRIRFSQAVALNDPFEIYPCFKLFSESIKRRSLAQLKRQMGRIDAINLTTASIMASKVVREKTAELQRELCMTHLMLCLTKERNNLLMWSHYTNAYRGFVIGFDSSHPFFHKEKPRSMTPLFEVKYSNRRPLVPPFEDCTNEDLIETMFLTKSLHWGYEEELRMFAKPEAADAIIKAEPVDIHLFNFPPESLREIIFGHLMEPRMKQKISDTVAERYPQVELFETNLNETEFKLDVVPYRKRG